METLNSSLSKEQQNNNKIDKVRSETPCSITDFMAMKSTINKRNAKSNHSKTILRIYTAPIHMTPQGGVTGD